MRGGALIPVDFNNIPLVVPEEDWDKMDQIQVTFTIFLERNLGSGYPTQLRSTISDTGESDPSQWRAYLFHVDRAKMYWLLVTALGRVELPTYPECGVEYKCIFFTLDEMGRLVQDMWGQDNGRSGGRNRYMSILATELTKQQDAYTDVRTYEGHPLPTFLPFVLAEQEWNQIYDDVIEHWEDYDPEPTNLS